MKARTHKQDSLRIVYDADCIQHPDTRLFEPEYWQRQGALAGEAEGRGKALLLDTDFAPAVLRQYLRGGWAARVSHDRYVFSGYERSRPVMEFNMLKKLSAAGLPVPGPLAAMCRRQGAFYTAWLMTRRIMDVCPLADLFQTRGDDLLLWRKTGECIRRFHDFGLVHADLNARNILVDEGDLIYLIDFDRARIRAGDSRSFQANLRRLRRSLEKLWPKSTSNLIEPSWRSLVKGTASSWRPNEQAAAPSIAGDRIPQDDPGCRDGRVDRRRSGRGGGAARRNRRRCTGELAPGPVRKYRNESGTGITA